MHRYNRELDVDLLTLLDIYGKLSLKTLSIMLQSKHIENYSNFDSFKSALRNHLRRLERKCCVKTYGMWVNRRWEITDMGNMMKWLLITILESKDKENNVNAI